MRRGPGPRALDGEGLDVHASLARAHGQVLALSTVQEDGEVVLGVEVDAIGDEDGAHRVALDVHAQDVAGAGSASSTVRASLTPPALPRPPVLTWALTTTSSLPASRRDCAALRASSGVVATAPSSTGTPCWRNRFLAWYSYRSMQLILSGHVDGLRAGQAPVMSLTSRYRSGRSDTGGRRRRLTQRGHRVSRRDVRAGTDERVEPILGPQADDVAALTSNNKG